MSPQQSFEWTDILGDEGRLQPDIPSLGHPAVAEFSIMCGDGVSEHAVFVNADQARAIILWLTERLKEAA